ncbi:MAG: hypothetical protein NT012_03785 [Candidatus Nealsonbacteria bacterium]|nr:hypothetical protein [Candidatus Nealsonbacteria bacterium]
MESFEENKKFGDIFCRYLKTNFGWSYDSIDPQKVIIPKGYPDVDVVLISGQKCPLYLQLKQPLDGCDRYIKFMAKSYLKVFKFCSFKTAIKKAENKYDKNGKDVSDIIILLHMHVKNAYLTLHDRDILEKITSNFRGIYLVSPEQELWKDGSKKIQSEFVFEIKRAF